MPSGTWVKFEFKEPFAMATGPGEAKVLYGTYVGNVSDDDPDVYDLFRLGPDGEAVGECEGQMSATITDAGPVKDR